MTMSTIKDIKNYVRQKYDEISHHSSGNSPEFKLIYEIDDFVKQISESKTAAEWIDPNAEMPPNEGVYLVITSKGNYAFAGYWVGEDEKINFVILTDMDKETTIKYWLKDEFPNLIRGQK